ncbi:MAG: cytochrome c oxidase subunit II [Nostocoides sp.]
MRRLRRPVVAGTLAVLGIVTLSGCRASWADGLLPRGVTEDSVLVNNLWVGAWIPVLLVGILVWGLTIYALIRFRAKDGDDELPEQVQYNIPLEVLYTVVPLLMVGVFFYFTARDESALMDTSKTPDVTINVVGKQWSWDFNYVDSNVHEAGTMAELTGNPGVEETLPTLYLPVDQRVEFVLTSRDVIHSFWVPAFLKKLDMIPGRVNKFQVVPNQIGTFQGKCAELCGAYHSQMLFNVKVVSQADYEQHMNDLKAAGQTGLLANDLNRDVIVDQDQHLIPTANGSN